MINNALFFLLILAASLLLTAFVRRYAMARDLLDVPNGRSSHQVPTPRGGGLAIVLAFFAGLSWLVWWGYLALPVLWGLLGAGGWVALVGLLDDHGHIPARWRLLAHFAGAAWVLVWLGELPPLLLPGSAVDLGWVGFPLGAVYLVWLLNLFNFMDGIDGLAALESITVCLGGVLVYLLAAPGGGGWVQPGLMAAAVAGFLYWNYPPARIFMGDVGSGFLGLMLGSFSLLAALAAPELFWCWVILLGVFVVDATVTLLRRVLRGERFYEAHRTHAYQYASRYYCSHQKVSLTTGAINIFWLLPVAVLVAEGMVDGLLGVGIAYAPLVWAAFRYKAGARELQDL